MSSSNPIDADIQSLEVRSECAASAAFSKQSSNKSSASAAAAKARAKAEAARTRAAYAKRQIDMQVEKARIEATLNALKEECEAEAASAEAQVFEAAADLDNCDLGSKASHAQATKQSLQRTGEFIQAHFSSGQSYALAQNEKETQAAASVPQHRHLPDIKVHCVSRDTQQPYPSACSAEGLHPGNQRKNRPDPLPFNTDRDVPSMHTHRCTDSTNQLPPRSPLEAQGVSELAVYLARRDLVTAGLKVFDNQPASYLSWKSSFVNAVEGLSLKPSEELDLLIKWLGGESLHHAKRIRAVYVNNPFMGLNMLWRRLDKCYGSPEAIEASLFDRLNHFPKLSNRDHQKLQELGDLLLEIEAAKQEGYLPGLSFLDTARGINPIAEKLPHNVQEQWITQGSRYKREHQVPYPPFSFFVDFVYNHAEMRNDPSFAFANFGSAVFKGDGSFSKQWKSKPPLSVSKTEVGNPPTSQSSKGLTVDLDRECPLHKKPHSLRKCRGFRERPLAERRRFLVEHSICFKCCASATHQAKECKADTHCSECDSDRHIAALHPGPAPWAPSSRPPSAEHGGEPTECVPDIAASSCTAVCGQGLKGKSCSKICLVSVYPKGRPDQKVRTYVMLDDQSNVSLARSAFFDMFDIQGEASPYTLKTCSGITETAGRRASGFMVESADGQLHLSLPTLIECNLIPNNRDEIPTPEAAQSHKHLRCIADRIPPLDASAEILLLLGRDIIRVHKVRSQRNGRHNEPYAQQVDLGWVIVGDVCLGGAHRPTVNTFKTNVLENGRPSYFKPCENRIICKEKFIEEQLISPDTLTSSRPSLGELVFSHSKEDDKLAPSIEDEIFLQIMNKEFKKDDSNSWVAPLPFRSPRPRLPNNREQALSRLMSLRRTLNRKPEMKHHFIDFMEDIFKNGHAEPAPPPEPDKEYWYLPSFGVYHPQKPGKIRIVFDSSAQFKGISLNDVLLQGPDLNNTLIGVLMRFRMDPVAVMTDIQQMFHSFLVREDHRDHLRFLWFRNHQLDDKVLEYRMRVHVFGNCPSPAVAIYGLKRTAMEGEEDYGPEVRSFVHRHFYVDDGLKSFLSAEDAIKVLKGAQDMLAQSNLRLHKIVSNSVEVMRAFPAEDLASNLQDLDVGQDSPPMQRSLGLGWDLATDTLTFHVDCAEKPFTRRGVLSTINSLFDPLGFAAPFSVQGRLILRELTTETCDWDAPLPREKLEQWQRWCTSLQDLRELKIPRAYTMVPLSTAQSKEICIFCDASTKAIAAVAYLRVTDAAGHSEVGFLFGKTKLAPKPDITIPRLELCAAVLAVELAEVMSAELDIQVDDIKLFSDSKVVLGYIFNDSRRFYVYVHNRVQRIRRSTNKSQWNYVPSDVNPADHATRAIPANQLAASSWLSGPAFLVDKQHCHLKQEAFSLVEPATDVELRPEVVTCATNLSFQLGSKRFERFSSWRSLTRAIARLCHIAYSFTRAAKEGPCHGWHNCKLLFSPDQLHHARIRILLAVQRQVYSEEIHCLQKGGQVPKQCSLSKLCPFIDSEGLLRVGGRLKKSQLTAEEGQPVIMPGKHHVTSLLIRHCHEQVCHQGRHLTEGALRSAGFWIVGGRRSVSSLVYNCVTCRRLRGREEEQIMADLPADRLSTDPPFTFVGLDVFGPWCVTSRRTRGGLANSKRWAIIFTCMSVRAIHIEVIESMDSSSFINALRRFFAVRGPVKQLRSDCGTNFVGACRELGITSKGCNNKEVSNYLSDQGCVWLFNPPHSSHMGGSWERMIGVTRRILDAMFLKLGSFQLTHEVLTTFMAEVTAIVNSRPLTSVSTDPDEPLILTPAMLLTQKIAVLPVPPGNFDDSNIFRHQWHQVQSLANTFWERWKREYLSSLQGRKKWRTERPNLMDGDVVLMKDNSLKRHDWPTGLIIRTFPSDNGKVRKVEVKVFRDSEVILLLQRNSVK